MDGVCDGRFAKTSHLAAMCVVLSFDCPTGRPAGGSELQAADIGARYTHFNYHQRTIYVNDVYSHHENHLNIRKSEFLFLFQLIFFQNGSIIIIIIPE